MDTQKSRKKGGAKLSRSETVTVRLDPKLRYLAELAARLQRRTLSSFIEWVIEETLKKIPINEYQSIFDSANALWDVSESERLVKLAQYYPDLLTYDEQLLWKLIQTFTTYNAPNEKISKFFDNGVANLELIRSCWSQLLGVVAGTVTEKQLHEALCSSDDMPF